MKSIKLSTKILFIILVIISLHSKVFASSDYLDTVGKTTEGSVLYFNPSYSDKKFIFYSGTYPDNATPVSSFQSTPNPLNFLTLPCGQLCGVSGDKYFWLGVYENDETTLIHYDQLHYTGSGTDTWNGYNITAQGTPIPPTPNYDITFTNPISGNSYSSPVTFSGTYQNSLGANYVLVHLASITSGVQDTDILIPIDSTISGGSFSVSFPISPANYYMTWRYYDSYLYLFGDWFPAENSTEYPITITSQYVPSIVYETCDTGDFFCYFRNAMRWAFTLPPAYFDKFTQLKDDLSQKAPFGYISSLFSDINNLTQSENPAFSVESIGIISDNIFSPLRQAFVWILYFAFAFMLFKRFSDIQI